MASHTQNHTNAWKASPWAANRDIGRGIATLRELGVHSGLFRPPFGKTTLASLFYRARHRLGFAYWTIDTQDSWDRRPVDDILGEIKEKGGGVVLMHDFGTPKRGPAPGAHRDYLLQVTREIISFARANNMVLCRFGDLGKSTGVSP